jgi:hypothetical protein
MSENPLRILLQESAETGQRPAEEAITAAMTSGSAEQRKAARKAAGITYKRIRNALEDGGEDVQATIAELIDDTVEAHTAVVGRRADDPNSPRNLAAEITAKRDESTTTREERRRDARSRIAHAAPLVELLSHAGPQGGLDDRDLDNFRLRSDIDPQQWRASVHRAAARVADIYRGGEHGRSREEARAAAEDLSRLVAQPPAHRDPHRDTDDPRELAQAIRGKSV